MQKLVRVEDVDWAEVAEKPKTGDKFNWCPVQRLKVASYLLYVWFLQDQDNEHNPVGAANAFSGKETPKAEISVNKTWLEIWGKEPTYSKFYVENEYLNSRGIRKEILEEFGVGFYSNPKSKSKLNDHILFRIHNSKGELLAFAWPTPSDEGQRYCFPPAEKFNKSLEIWNFHRAIKEGSRVLVVEGFFGAMNLWQHSYRCVVALMGSSLSEAQCELLSDFETATFLLDPDEAGQKLKKQVITSLLPLMPVRIVESDTQPDQMTIDQLKEILR